MSAPRGPIKFSSGQGRNVKNATENRLTESRTVPERPQTGCRGFGSKVATKYPPDQACKLRDPPLQPAGADCARNSRAIRRSASRHCDTSTSAQIAFPEQRPCRPAREAGISSPRPRPESGGRHPEAGIRGEARARVRSLPDSSADGAGATGMRRAVRHDWHGGGADVARRDGSWRADVPDPVPGAPIGNPACRRMTAAACGRSMPDRGRHLPDAPGRRRAARGGREDPRAGDPGPKRRGRGRFDGGPVPARSGAPAGLRPCPPWPSLARLARSGPSGRVGSGPAGSGPGGGRREDVRSGGHRPSCRPQAPHRTSAACGHGRTRFHRA